MPNVTDKDYIAITIKIPPGIFEGIKLLAQRRRIPLEVKASTLLRDMILHYEEIYDEPAGPDGPIGLQGAIKYLQEKRQKEAELSRRPLPSLKVTELNVGGDGIISGGRGLIE